MKSILNLIAILLSFSLFAQEKTYTQAMDSLLSHVDKSTMTTGILYNRAASYDDLDTNTSPTITPEYFMQAWNELYNASTSSPFISADALQEQINEKKQSGKVILGVINLKMNYLDYGTQANPNISFSNGYFWNIPGKDPMREKNISLVLPLASSAESSTVTYIISKDFFAQDAYSPPLTSLQINFGNGAVHTYNVSGNFAPIEQVVSYISAGSRTVAMKMSFADGSYKSVDALVNVSDPPASVSEKGGSYNEYETFDNAASITQTIPFTGYYESTPKMGQLEYRTFYNRVSNAGYQHGTGDFDGHFPDPPKLRKPVIILDGFDPGNTRNLDLIYDLMKYDHDKNIQTPPKSLVSDLQNQGYDVTLVNFQDGAGFIERNAMALVALIQRENAKLAANGSTEKLTIIGPSMGGLISRYALAYMEKNNMQHNTKLWVSFDSPHLGANIPISAQRNLYFYGFQGGAQQAKTKYIENFRSPAARQMLIEQLDAYPVSTSYDATQGMNNGAPFRQKFMQNLTSNGLPNSNGFPQNLRKIAVTNGTTNGAKTNNENDCILEMAAFKKILGINNKVATLVDYNLPPLNNSALNFEGRVTTTGFLSVTVSNTKKYLSNNNPRGSMDVVQGGRYNTQGIIKDEFTPVLNDQTTYHEWRQYRPNHSFIPTVSSLAFKNPNFDWNTSFNRNLICNSEIPFDTYFVPAVNQDHVFVTNELVQWLTAEINGQPQVPHLNLDNFTLSVGKKLICNNESIFVSTNASNLCSLPGNYTWSTNEKLMIVSSNRNNSIEVKAAGEGLGKVYLNFGNGQRVEQTIWIGKPRVIIEQNYTNINKRLSLYLKSAVPGATLEDQGILPAETVWYRPSQGISHRGVLEYTFFAPTGSDFYTVEVSATNSCGTASDSGEFIPDSTDCGYSVAKSNGDNYNIINPCGPTYGYSKGATSNTDKMTRLTTKVYNAMGTQILSTTRFEFSLAGQMPGAYYLKVFKDGNVVHAQTLLKN